MFKDQAVREYCLCVCGGGLVGLLDQAARSRTDKNTDGSSPFTPIICFVFALNELFLLTVAYNIISFCDYV